MRSKRGSNLISRSRPLNDDYATTNPHNGFSFQELSLTQDLLCLPPQWPFKSLDSNGEFFRFAVGRYLQMLRLDGVPMLENLSIGN